MKYPVKNFPWEPGYVFKPCTEKLHKALVCLLFSDNAITKVPYTQVDDVSNIVVCHKGKLAIVWEAVASEFFFWTINNNILYRRVKNPKVCSSLV